jgi:hypothetical protein
VDGPEHRDRPSPEAVRCFILFGTALWLAHSYFSSRMIGTGDALWYYNSLADAVTQFRAGVFPVFVGQSDFSFNGSVYPLRAAPYFQYLAGLLDALTLHRLDFLSLEHLTAILSIVGGVLVTYWALVWVAPKSRWQAAALAILYASSPGVIGLFYAQDLYMSGMAIPWVPLAFAAALRSFEDQSLCPLAILAASLAALWWAHSPIAFWATAMATVGQLARIAAGGTSRHSLKRQVQAASIFCILAAYPIISVFLLRTPGEPIVPYTMDREALLKVVGDSFPSSILPLQIGQPNLSFLQVGYSLWFLLLLSLAVWPHQKPRAAGAVLIGSALFLILLLLPVPGATRFLWFHFPETIVGMTLYWPMQRFCILIAAATVVVAQALVWRGNASALSERFRFAGSLALACAVAWSGFEMTRFFQLAKLQSQSPQDSRRWDRLENVAVQRHTYGLFPRRPTYFTHGVVEPRLEVHLLDVQSGKVVASDYGAALSAQSGQEFICRIDANPGILDLGPPIRLLPGEKYFLTFAFNRADTRGVLQLSGPTFYREYALPSSGEAKSFGSSAQSERSIVVWTTMSAPETISLRFIPTGERAAPTDFIPFARFAQQKIDEQELPIRVTSLIPFRATVDSRTPALLETPRMYVPGYKATVGGEPTRVGRSEENLVEVPIPAGRSTVEIRYAGPPLLHLAFWGSFCAWVLAVIWGLSIAIRSLHARAAEEIRIRLTQRS